MTLGSIVRKAAASILGSIAIASAGPIVLPQLELEAYAEEARPDPAPFVREIQEYAAGNESTEEYRATHPDDPPGLSEVEIQRCERFYRHFSERISDLSPLIPAIYRIIRGNTDTGRPTIFGTSPIEIEIPAGMSWSEGLREFTGNTELFSYADETDRQRMYDTYIEVQRRGDNIVLWGNRFSTDYRLELEKWPFLAMVLASIDAYSDDIMRLARADDTESEVPPPIIEDGDGPEVPDPIVEDGDSPEEQAELDPSPGTMAGSVEDIGTDTGEDTGGIEEDVSEEARTRTVRVPRYAISFGVVGGIGGILASVPHFGNEDGDYTTYDYDREDWGLNSYAGAGDGSNFIFLPGVFVQADFLTRSRFTLGPYFTVMSDFGWFADDIEYVERLHVDSMARGPFIDPLGDPIVDLSSRAVVDESRISASYGATTMFDFGIDLGASGLRRVPYLAGSVGLVVGYSHVRSTVQEIEDNDINVYYSDTVSEDCTGSGFLYDYCSGATLEESTHDGGVVGVGASFGLVIAPIERLLLRFNLQFMVNTGDIMPSTAHIYFTMGIGPRFPFNYVERTYQLPQEQVEPESQPESEESRPTD